MAGICCNGWTWLEMAGNYLKLLKSFENAGNSKNGRKWLDMVGHY